MDVFIYWLIFSVIVGIIAREKRIGFFGGFFLSLLLSPLIGLIIALVSKSKEQAVTITPPTTNSGTRYQSSKQLPPVLEFQPEGFPVNEIANVTKGDFVKFWAKPDQTAVYIYRRGSLGGDGYLGKVPNEWRNSFIKYLAQNDDVENEIVYRGINSITIQCRF